MSPINFELTYNEQKVVFESGYVGHETVYLNGEIVSKSFNWKRKNDHLINIQGEDLVLRIEVISMLKGNLRVSLLKGKEVIEVQNKQFSFEDGLEGDFGFSDTEKSWKKEIEMATSTTVIMYIVFYSMIAFDLNTSVLESSLFQTVTLVVIASAALYGVIDFLKTAVRDLRSHIKNDMGEPELFK